MTVQLVGLVTLLLSTVLYSFYVRCRNSQTISHCVQDIGEARQFLSFLNGRTAFLVAVVTFNFGVSGIGGKRNTYICVCIWNVWDSLHLVHLYIRVLTALLLWWVGGHASWMTCLFVHGMLMVGGLLVQCSTLLAQARHGRCMYVGVYPPIHGRCTYVGVYPPIHGRCTYVGVYPPIHGRCTYVGVYPPIQLILLSPVFSMLCRSDWSPWSC